MKKRILFVCTENENRSPTAEELFENNKTYETKSVGISETAKKIITKEAIHWSDVIFCMEDLHKNFILENFPSAKGKDIRVLDIGDIYHKNDSELIRILKEKLKKFFS